MSPRQTQSNIAQSRQATRADISAMHRVRLAVCENRLSSPGRITDEDYRVAIEERGRGWVAEVNGQIIGFAIGDARDGNIWAVFVDPQFEGLGYGRSLHNIMVEWLWSRGLQRLWLGTAAGTRAERFYLALGWRVCGSMDKAELRLELDRPGPE